MKNRIIIALLFIIILLIRKALWPFFAGICLAYILNPCVDLLCRKMKISRLACTLLTYLIVLTAFISITFVFLRLIAVNLQNDSVLDTIQFAKEFYHKHQAFFTGKIGEKINFDQMAYFIQGVSSGTIKFLVAIIISIYLVKDKDFFFRLTNQAMHLLFTQKTHGYIREIGYEIDIVISSFLRGICIDSVIVALLSASALWVLQVSHAFFIGCFVGIVNIIPYFGPFIGMAPAAIIAFTNGGIIKSTLAVATLFVIQQIECNLIYPRIIGKTTGLHPLFVLITVTIAGYYGGLLSMVLAVPFAGIIKVLVCKWAYIQ